MILHMKLALYLELTNLDWKKKKKWFEIFNSGVRNEEISLKEKILDYLLEVFFSIWFPLKMDGILK